MKKQPNKKKPKADLKDRLADADDLMSAILEVNDRLEEGKITVEQARALTGNYKLAVKIIEGELTAAKFTGRLDNTNKRWYPRVAQSRRSVGVAPDLMEQFQAMMDKVQAKPEKKRPPVKN